MAPQAWRQESGSSAVSKEEGDLGVLVFFFFFFGHRDRENCDIFSVELNNSKVKYLSSFILSQKKLNSCYEHYYVTYSYPPPLHFRRGTTDISRASKTRVCGFFGATAGPCVIY